MGSVIDLQVEKALEYKNKEQFQKSIDILEEVISHNPNYSKINGIMVVLAGNYYRLKQQEKTIYYSNKVLSNNHKVELASLLLYLSYFDLDQHEKAFYTLFNYLKKHPANLFKDTLEELLEGLLDGYSVTYKDDIIFYAEKNNIIIPSGL